MYWHRHGVNEVPLWRTRTDCGVGTDGRIRAAAPAGAVVGPGYSVPGAPGQRVTKLHLFCPLPPLGDSTSR